MDGGSMGVSRIDEKGRMDQSRYPSGWNVTIHRQDGNTLSLQVNIPPHAQVGIWRCSIQTNFQGQTSHRDSHRRDYKV